MDRIRSIVGQVWGRLRPCVQERIGIRLRFDAECIGPDGAVKWHDVADSVTDFYTGVRREIRATALVLAAAGVWALDPTGGVLTIGVFGLVVTTGRNALLDNSFNAVAGSVSWFVGLKGTGSVVAGDTLASHAGWSEINPYTGNRPAWTKNAAASAGAMSNSSAKASIAITSTVTVFGAFLASVNTGTGGTLFGAGDFATSRAVENLDTLNVQVDLSITAS